MATATALTLGVVKSVSEAIHFVTEMFDLQGQKLFDRSLDRARELCIKTGLVPVLNERQLVENAVILPDRNEFFRKMVPIRPALDPDDFND